MAHFFSLLLITLFFTPIIHGQSLQTKEEIQDLRKNRIKTTRIITRQYSSWAGDPEGRLEVTDTSFKYYDTSGRIIKEKFQSGIHFLRKLTYNAASLPVKETWYMSSLDKYPNPQIPRKEEDYNTVFLTDTYTYDSANRLSSIIIDAPVWKKTTYQYNNVGDLIATIQVDKDGQVLLFEITKYGSGDNRNKIEQSVSSLSGVVRITNFEYDDQHKLKASKTTYDDGRVRKAHYNGKEQLQYEEVFNKDNKLVARFEFVYGTQGLSKTISYRPPAYNSAEEARFEGQANKLRLSEEELYEYETY